MGTRSDLPRRPVVRVLMPLVCLLAVTVVSELRAADQAPRRPNVLFVFSDMQRAYSMGCYGDTNARTPHLDAFARAGARFDAAISNTPVCCPYRACLMSGQYAHHNGVMSNGVWFRPGAKCVAETFRDAGYETGYSGKWHMIGCQGLKAKRWPHEESARIPLLIRYPRCIKPGTVIADPIGSPDMYPTLAGLAGVETPEGLDGADFAPLIRGEASKPPRDFVYLEMQYAYVPWPGWRALRTRDMMFARTADKPWLLFDLAKDPWQMKNLVDDPASQAVVKQMDARLTKIMRETGDSWDIQADSGDLEKWRPGAAKQRGQASLGADWPGKAIDTKTPATPAGKAIDTKSPATPAGKKGKKGKKARAAKSK